MGKINKAKLKATGIVSGLLGLTLLLAGCENNEQNEYKAKQESKIAYKVQHQPLSAKRRAAAARVKKYDLANPYSKIEDVPHSHDLIQDGVRLPIIMTDQALKQQSKNDKIKLEANRAINVKLTAKQSKDIKVAAPLAKFYFASQPYSYQQMKKVIGDRFTPQIAKKLLSPNYSAYSANAIFKTIQVYGLYNMPTKSKADKMLKANGFKDSDIQWVNKRLQLKD